jgi:hypothetical protein
MRLPQHLLGTLAGLLSLLAGLFMVNNELGALFFYYDAEATVLGSGVITLHDSYKADILYQYEADGKNYTGRCCSAPFNFKKSADRFVAGYPVNGTAEIRVNPQNPSVSRVKEDLDPSSLPFMGIFILVGGVFTVLFGLRMIDELRGKDPQA